MADNDRRADLEAAFAAAEAADDTPEPDYEPEPSEIAPKHVPADGSDKNPVQKPLKGDAEFEEEPELPLQQETKPEKTEKQPKQDAKQEGKPPKAEKKPTAPIGWSPEARAEFEKLPESVQKAAQHREAEIARAFEETTAARRVAEGLYRTVEPYRAMMVAEGVQDPLQAVDGLLKTAAILHMGTPAQKAQRMAQLSQHYGIDIELLDKALAGQTPQDKSEDQVSQRVQQMVNQQMQPFNQFMQQLNYQQQQQYAQVQHEAVSSVQEMLESPNYPHADAVRTVMADFLDMAAARGQNMSLDEAYQRACAITPGVSELVQQERMNGMMQQNQQHIGHKRNAASSIVGRPSGGGGQGDKPNFESMSLRDVIAAQIPGGRV